MGCGASTKTRDQTEDSMLRKSKASSKTNGAPPQKDEGTADKKSLKQKIQSFLSVSEDDTKEALSLAEKHPDDEDDFVHVVNIMHPVIRSNPEEFVNQLVSFRRFRESSTSAVGKDLMDFFALIGGARVMAEMYGEQLKAMNITHLTDDLEVGEEHFEAFNIITIMRMFWESATDCSLEFGGRLAETKVLSYLTEDLKNLEDDFCAENEVFDRSLTIVHNCARNKQKRQHFHDVGAVQLLKPFLARQEKGIKLLSLLTLSYIIGEEDNHLLFADASDFDFLLEAVSVAWEDEDHRDPNGYSLEELLQGLGNLAQNDDNKKLLMEKDALVLLKPVLETGADVEKQEAAQIVWNLAFDKDNRKKMEKDKKLMEHLERLKNSSHRGVAKSCSGALWVLNMDKKVLKGGATQGYRSGPPPPPPLPSSSSSGPPPPQPPLQAPVPQAPPMPAERTGKGHVMISYQWGNQKMLLQLKQSLRSHGFQVWMDVDNIKGSTLQAMAEAVEEAEALLLCMSQRYKDSPNCRTEAEYAFALQKPIIPLLMERNYKPDGWLGILRGSKLFFDFSGKYPYDKKLDDLVKELGHRGRSDPSEVDGPIKGEKSRPVASTPVVNVTTWSQKDVLNWLNKHQLSKCQKLQSLSGENIKFLQKLSSRAPEFFFTYLKQDLGLTSLNDLMHFSDAIDNLP